MRVSRLFVGMAAILICLVALRAESPPVQPVGVASPAPFTSSEWQKIYKRNGHGNETLVRISRSQAKIVGTFERTADGEAPASTAFTAEATNSSDKKALILRHVHFADERVIEAERFAGAPSAVDWRITIDAKSQREVLMIRRGDLAEARKYLGPKAQIDPYSRLFLVARVEEYAREGMPAGKTAEELAADDEKSATPAPTVNRGDVRENSEPPTVTESALQSEIEKALGKSYRKVKRVWGVKIEEQAINVHFSINDNLTDGLIKSSARTDIQRILKAVHTAAYPYKAITVTGTFLLKDAFGNSTEREVVRATYKRSTVDKINWEGFEPDNVFRLGIAEDVWLHPTFY